MKVEFANNAIIGVIIAQISFLQPARAAILVYYFIKIIFLRHAQQKHLILLIISGNAIIVTLIAKNAMVLHQRIAQNVKALAIYT